MKYQIIRHSFVLAVLAAFSACTSGGGRQIDSPLTPSEANVTCQAELALTGASSNALDEEGGCSPLGQWQLFVSVVNPGNCPNVPVGSQYNYVVSMDGDQYHVDFQGPGAAGNVRAGVKVEGGACAGTFTHELDQFSMVQLKASAMVGGLVYGDGSYQTLNEPL
jgi:hypothetical protein